MSLVRTIMYQIVLELKVPLFSFPLKFVILNTTFVVQTELIACSVHGLGPKVLPI
jgi:hypothetical protein